MPFREKKDLERGKDAAIIALPPPPPLPPNKCTVIYLHLLRTGLLGSGEGFALRRTLRNVKVNVAVRKAY
jgi:hypothetical protein